MPLPPYLTLLARRWRLLAAGAALAALAALVVTLLLPKTYEATATILVTRPSYQFQFDPRLSNAVSPQNLLTVPSKAYMALARTDAVERAVVQELGPRLENGEREPGALLGRVKVEQAGGSRGDPNVFEIKAQAGDPDRAQAIANAWANTYLKLAEQLYSQSDQKLAFLAKELTEAGANLKASEDALVAFQRSSRIPNLEGQLSAVLNLYNGHLAARTNVRLVRQDAINLQNQLASDPGGAGANAGLPTLLLQIRGLNAAGASQLQIPVSDLRQVSGPDAQVRQVEGLIQALEHHEAVVTQQVEAIEATNQVQAPQAELQAARNELDRLTRERDLKKTTYTTVANKAEEARVESSAQAKEVQLASAAARPERPVGRGVPIVTALAALVGLLVSAGVVVVSEYLPGLSRWREEEESLPVPALGR